MHHSYCCLWNISRWFYLIKSEWNPKYSKSNGLNKKILRISKLLASGSTSNTSLFDLDIVLHFLIFKWSWMVVLVRDFFERKGLKREIVFRLWEEILWSDLNRFLIVFLFYPYAPILFRAEVTVFSLFSKMPPRFSSIQIISENLINDTYLSSFHIQIWVHIYIYIYMFMWDKAVSVRPVRRTSFYMKLHRKTLWR